MVDRLDDGTSHFSDFVEELKALVRIPSASAAGFPTAAVRASAEAVCDHVRRAGDLEKSIRAAMLPYEAIGQ